MFSEATPNLFLDPAYPETPQKERKAWQGEAELALHVQIPRTLVHMCGRVPRGQQKQCRDREVGSPGCKTGLVTPCFWETWRVHALSISFATSVLGKGDNI